MEKALQTMIDNMPEKTGKSLEEWKKILNPKSFEKHSHIVSFLKIEYRLTHGYANTIAAIFKNDNNSPEDLLRGQYRRKESLMPIYERLVSMVEAFGEDVAVTPKKAAVSIARNRQFALIKPATKTRVDLGLKLKNTPTTDRLQNSGSFGTMCTHMVQLTDIVQIDDELKQWLRLAYTQAG